MINYKILGHSQDFYSSNGFNVIELPWTVTRAISNITKPESVDDYFIPSKNKVLVGSGEQGFLYLYLKGFLPKGKFCGTTPCFRDEVFDFIHSKYFMKTELIVTDNVNDNERNRLIQTAFEFFSLYLPKENLKVIECDSEDKAGAGTSYDICYVDDDCEIELGSYGIRSCEYLDWIYGTGCSEPRLSRVINLHKSNH